MTRIRPALLVLSVVLALGATPAAAQSFNLRDLLTDFLRQGITLAPPTAGPSHAAHFIGDDSPQFRALGAFSGLVANELSSFPLASSGGGFTYRFDPNLGVLTRTTESFGPVYAERADTVGKGQFNFGMNYSSFTFDAVDSLDLRGGAIRLVFSHLDANQDGSNLTLFFEGDLVTAQLFLKVKTNLSAFVLNYGLLDNLDVSVAVPLVNVSLDARTEAHVQRIASGNSTLSTIHRFLNGTTEDAFAQSGSASGLGDVIVRAKYQPLRGARGGLALAAEARVPTGEERDLLGTGTWRGKASLIGSLRFGAFSPHVNAGYAFSSTQQGESIPDEITYAGGFDWALHPRMTFAVDVLGRNIRNGNRVRVLEEEFTANQNGSLDPRTPPVLVTAVFPRLTVARESSRNVLNGSVGVKFNPVGNLLLTINGLFSISRTSLEDKFTPLVGLEYSF